MTERKPPDVGWESWVERLIREAMERGDFDNLPGQGKPIPGLDGPDDEMWWIRDKLRREQVSHLPPALALRKELDEAMDRIAAARTEVEVRRHVAAINDRIIYLNAHTTSGPPSSLTPLDVDRVLEEWRHRGD
jgi:DnaJ-like protein